MKTIVVNSFTEVAEQKPTVLAVGNFDGVHRGHQALLQQVVHAAKAINARSAALTFFPHPREVIQGRSDPFYLSRFSERVEQIAEQGIDLIITHPFNQQVRNMRAANFVAQMVAHLDLKQLWGGSFSLGYRREGDFAYLTQAGQAAGFSVHRFAPVHENETHISSSTIRQLLRNARVAEAAQLLTRPYAVSGEVIYGRQLGRTIGFPTANIAVWKKQLLPENGVYASYIHIDGKRYAAATNVGVRPTIEPNQPITIEAHILDFSADIYHKHVRLDFIDHVRPEQKFGGLDALKTQIKQDVAQVRQILALQPPLC